MTTSLRPSPFLFTASALLATVLAPGCAAKSPAPAAATAQPAPSGILSSSVLASGHGETDVAADRLLRRACYDCHSSEGAAPWYAKMAFSYWVPNDALKTANFSDWGTYDAKRQAETRKAIADVVKSGEMPPIDYRFLHPAAGLTKEQADVVVAWAEAPARTEGTAVPLP